MSNLLIYSFKINQIVPMNSICAYTVHCWLESRKQSRRYGYPIHHALDIVQCYLCQRVRKERAADRETFNQFIAEICRFDKEKSIYQIIWQRFQNIRRCLIIAICFPAILGFSKWQNN